MRGCAKHSLRRRWGKRMTVCPKRLRLSPPDSPRGSGQTRIQFHIGSIEAMPRAIGAANPPHRTGDDTLFMKPVCSQIEMDSFITEIPHFQRLKFPTFII